jgi:hypothetical protein
MAHLASDHAGNIRVVDSLSAVGADIFDFVAKPFEQIDDLALDRVSAMIAADGNFHGRLAPQTYDLQT